MSNPPSQKDTEKVARLAVQLYEEDRDRQSTIQAVREMGIPEEYVSRATQILHGKKNRATTVRQQINSVMYPFSAVVVGTVTWFIFKPSAIVCCATAVIFLAFRLIPLLIDYLTPGVSARQLQQYVKAAQSFLDVPNDCHAKVNMSLQLKDGGRYDGAFSKEANSNTATHHNRIESPSRSQTQSEFYFRVGNREP